MEILIKSFNRVFYLDRCIKSIYDFVQGDFSIKVLDDGTPQKYLSKLQEKYPDIQIETSKNYQDKSKAIEENLKSGQTINGFKIPTDLWIDAVRNSTPYFIMTEDDVWFTEKINIADLEEKMKRKSTSLIKLGWLGKGMQRKVSYLKEDKLNYLQMKFLTAPYGFMKMFFFNKYKLFSLMFRLKLVDNQTTKDYFILNSYLMGMYEKKYWLKLWENSEGKLNEKNQLLNASMWFRKHKSNKYLIAHLEQEAMKTTYKSSSSNSYHSYEIDFDVDRFNHILNELWFNNQFNIEENFPKDFSDGYILSLLKENPHQKTQPENWKRWAEHFKTQYRNLGCEVDD